MSLKKDIIGAAERVADSAVESVIDAIVAAGYERRNNAAWWYVFHREMLASLPKWRWLARRIHRSEMRRSAAFMKANRAFRNVCPFALVREADKVAT